MTQAAQLYRLTLDSFPDMDQMEFPDIDRRDWPTEYKVSYFYAELLWKMEDWTQCGPAFDRVVEIDPNGFESNLVAGLVARMQGDFPKAKRHLSTAHLMQPIAGRAGFGFVARP